MKYRNFKQARAHGWTLKKFNTAKKISAAWRLRKKFSQGKKIEGIKTIKERLKNVAGAPRAMLKGKRKNYSITGFNSHGIKNKSMCEFQYSQNFARTKEEVKEWVLAWKKRNFKVKLWAQNTTQQDYERWRMRTVKWAAKNLIELGWTYEPEFYASMGWLYPDW